MGLFAPLALLALPLLGLIVVLYLLRFRRPSAPVGSLHLWQSLTRDREANSLWQRLHVSTLLVLQLLAMLVLILALARPWVPSALTSGQNAIIVVDISASMSATDGVARGHSTRLAVALEQARNVIDNLPQGASATLISSEAHAAVLVPSTGDKARLRDALASLRPQAADTDMSEAMKLAGVVAVRQPHSTIWIVSDGIFPPVSGSSDSLPAQVRFLPVGTGGSNQAITALSVGQAAGRLSLFAQIANSDNLTVSRRLDLSVDDAPWNARTIVLSPCETQQVIVDDVPLGARVIEAHLAGTDDMEMDDTAWTVNRASVPANVLLVSGGNKFLELAAGLLPDVTLYKVAPGDYDPSDVINGAPPDLTILDSDILSSTMQKLPSGNLLFVGPKNSNTLFTVQGVLSAPQPSFSPLDTGPLQPEKDASDRDPLLRFVDLSSLHVAKAAAINLPQWGHVVLGSDKGPLILAGEESGRKIGVLAFDLHDTDLPVQTAYPLLMRNLITYLLPDPAGGVPVAVPPKALVSLVATDKTISRIVVEDPSGKEWSYAVGTDLRSIAFAETSLLGVYYVTQYTGTDIVAQEAFAVNLASHDESMIRPNLSPGLPKGLTSEAAAAGQPPNAPLNVDSVFEREIWPYVALVGFAVLLLEWLFAQRMAIRRAMIERRARRARRRLERA